MRSFPDEMRIRNFANLTCLCDSNLESCFSILHFLFCGIQPIATSSVHLERIDKKLRMVGRASASWADLGGKPHTRIAAAALPLQLKPVIGALSWELLESLAMSTEQVESDGGGRRDGKILCPDQTLRRCCQRRRQQPQILLRFFG